MIVPWTAEENRALGEMCAQDMSASEIAIEINRLTGSTFTRNAVIGRTRRAGIALPRAASGNWSAHHVPEEPAVVRELAPEEPAVVRELAPRRWKPGGILLRLGWLEGAFR